jgi:hypothetical protein
VFRVAKGQMSHKYSRGLVCPCLALGLSLAKGCGTLGAHGMAHVHAFARLGCLRRTRSGLDWCTSKRAGPGPGPGLG